MAVLSRIFLVLLPGKSTFEGSEKSGLRRHEAFPHGPSPCGNIFGFSFHINPDCGGFGGKEQPWDMVKLEFPNGQEREQHQECEPVSFHRLWAPPVFLVWSVLCLSRFLNGCFFLTKGKMQNREVC